MIFELSETKVADWLMKEQSYTQARVFIPDARCLYSSRRMSKWMETRQGTVAKNYTSEEM